MKQRMWLYGTLAGILMVLAWLPAFGQNAVGDFSGTITLRSGQALKGTIKLAEFGVVYGSSIGTLQPEYGAIELNVDGQKVTTPGRDIWGVQANWKNDGTQDAANWVIAEMVVTKKDGSQVVGKPTWQLHCSTSSVVLENGESRRVSAIPLTQKDFTADNFIQQVVIGDKQPPAAPLTAAPAEGTTAAPAEGTAAAPAEGTTTAPAEGTTTAPAEGTAAAPAEGTAAAPAEGTTTAPAEGTAAAPVEGTAAAPAEGTAAAPAEGTAAAPAEGTAAAPAEGTAAAPAEGTAAAPAEGTAAAPAEGTAAAPAETAPAIAPVPVDCELTFVNLTNAAEKARVEEAIAKVAVDARVAMVEGKAPGSVTVGFQLADVTALPALVEAIRYKAAADGSKALVFEESGRAVTSTFRTAAISGTITVSVSFTVAPGAKLFYSPTPGKEEEVAAKKIDEDGSVALQVAIVKGQECIYARTVLGEVEKCIKIDIFTGATEEITKAQYETHK